MSCPGRASILLWVFVEHLLKFEHLLNNECLELLTLQEGLSCRKFSCMCPALNALISSQGAQGALVLTGMSMHAPSSAAWMASSYLAFPK